MTGTALFVIALVVFGYAALSGRLAGKAITAPIAFTVIGWLLGPSVIDAVDPGLDESAVEVLAEVTLVLVLFADATRIDLSVLRRQLQIPIRLLAIGLPLAIGLGGVAALLLFDQISVLEALLVGAILAPTDAALGQAVVSNSAVPVRVRQALNVESGLNDGIALPVVAALAAAAVGSGTVGSEWIGDAVVELVFGVAAGALAGTLGGLVVRSGSERLGLSGTPRQLATLAVPAIAYGLTHVTVGNGFIAAFVAGVAFGWSAREVCEGAQDFTEDEGQLLTWLTFFVFGASMVGPALAEIDWRVALYAGLSLTVVRLLAVFTATVGLGLRRSTGAFIGWFGPRGLASILFVLLVLEQAVPERATIEHVVTITVLASVLLHGFTARPLAKRYGASMGSMSEGPEMMAVDEMPVARRAGLTQWLSSSGKPQSETPPG